MKTRRTAIRLTAAAAMAALLAACKEKAGEGPTSGGNADSGY